MLLGVVAILVGVYSRETISDHENTPILAKVWNLWGLRTLVAGSLFVQIILIIFGNRRKHIVNKSFKFWIWIFYLLADWIATFALGILSRDTKDHKTETNIVIMAIWAPFLLVHLGGPDTITAYSLEDNELWPRHMLDLIYQLIVVVYVVYRSLNTNPLTYVAIPVVIAGTIKYVERILSLWSGSMNGFRESILDPPDPGPNYAKFMDDYIAKENEGYHVTFEVNETTSTVLVHNSQEETIIPNRDIPDSEALHDGFKFYKIPECLFADLIFSFQDHTSSQFFYQKAKWIDAFKAVEVELGLIYDILYTKAVLTYSKWGILLKSVSFFCILSAFIAFTFLISKQNIYIELDSEGNKHRNYNLIITFVLFIGAILLEIYAVIVLLSSSWVMNWLRKHKNREVDLLYKFISICQFIFKISHTIRWSNQMSQFNLISFCLKDEPVKCIKLLKCVPRIYKFFEKSYYQKTKQVSEGLKKLIFDQLKDKSKEAKGIEACKKLCAHKGDWVLNRWKCRICDEQNCHIHGEQNSHIHDELNSRFNEEQNYHICVINQSIKEVEFDESILLWHIATDLCYSADDKEPQSATIRSREESKLLSDYMLYLLVMCPFLLPNGIGEIRFEDTCAEVDELLKERKYIKERSEVCKIILRVNTDIPPSEVKGDRSKSVLFDACRLAKSLESLGEGEHGSKEKKWDMISNVWVEMLCHAASQCRGLNHAKQLSQGGELLTHVWLLMAHLGITEQFQISKGHVRAKLVIG